MPSVNELIFGAQIPERQHPRHSSNTLPLQEPTSNHEPISNSIPTITEAIKQSTQTQTPMPDSTQTKAINSQFTSITNNIVENYFADTPV